MPVATRSYMSFRRPSLEGGGGVAGRTTETNGDKGGWVSYRVVADVATPRIIGAVASSARVGFLSVVVVIGVVFLGRRRWRRHATQWKR